MPLQILVAENDPDTMQTTVEALESEFEIVRATNFDEAREAANTHPELAAILMDGRLEQDGDLKDRSGWELAAELQATGIARAPIIIYSQFEQTHDNDAVGVVPRITYLRKEVDVELIKRILEDIHQNLQVDTNLEETPRYHQPPILAFAHNGRNNGFKVIADELKKKGEPTQVLDNLDELKSAMNLHPSAMFAVDVTNQVGLEAINVLHTQRSNRYQNFYIAALTGDEVRPDVLHAGIDAVVSKDSPQTVAFEIMVRKAEFKIQIERKQLALRQYRKLVTQLEKNKDSDSQEVSAALHTVQRALDWPFLLSNEKVILTSLYLQLLQAKKTGMNAGIWDLCIEGSKMLTLDRAEAANVKDWMERARRSSPAFTLTWLDDDALSGDIEDKHD
jgi:CheY-like chemotaxis protein